MTIVKRKKVGRVGSQSNKMDETPSGTSNQSNRQEEEEDKIHESNGLITADLNELDSSSSLSSLSSLVESSNSLIPSNSEGSIHLGTFPSFGPDGASISHSQQFSVNNSKSLPIGSGTEPDDSDIRQHVNSLSLDSSEVGLSQVHRSRSPIRGDAAKALEALNSTIMSSSSPVGNVSDLPDDSQSQATQLVHVMSSPLFGQRIPPVDLKNNEEEMILDFDGLASSPVEERSDSNEERDGKEEDDDDDEIFGNVNIGLIAAEDSQFQKFRSRKKAIEKLRRGPDTRIQLDQDGLVHLNVGGKSFENNSNDLSDHNRNDENENAKNDSNNRSNNNKKIYSDLSDITHNNEEGTNNPSQFGDTQLVHTQQIDNSDPQPFASLEQQTQPVRTPLEIPKNLFGSRAERELSPTKAQDNDESGESSSNKSSIANNELGSQNSHSPHAVTLVMGTPRQEMGELRRQPSNVFSLPNSLESAEVISSDNEEDDNSNKKKFSQNSLSDKEEEAEVVEGDEIGEERITSSPEKDVPHLPSDIKTPGGISKLYSDDNFISSIPGTSPNITPGTIIRKATKRAKLDLEAAHKKLISEQQDKVDKNHVEIENEQLDKGEVVNDEEDEDDEDQIPSKRKADGRKVIPRIDLSQPSSSLSQQHVLSSPPPAQIPETAVWVIWNKNQWYVVKVLDNLSVGSLFIDSQINNIKNESNMVIKMEHRQLSPARLNILFSNGDVSDASIENIRRLDLREGDKVKLDDDKKPNFEIIGLLHNSHNSSSSSDSSPDRTGWAGFTGVTSVRVKHVKTLEERTVAIRHLYMTSAQTSQYLGKRQQQKNLFTEEVGVWAPALRRHKSFSNEQVIVSPTSASGSANTTTANVGIVPRPPEGIFASCVFTISAVDKKDLAYLTDAITKNGGIVLDNGLQELFEISYSTLDMKWTGLNNAKLFTFGGVLAKSSLRTPKYLEGLALGWPCLSWRFIVDSLEDGKMIQDWENYVLAAGSSNVLDKSHCSYDVSLFKQNWTRGANLADQFNARKLILGSESILADHLYLLNHDPKDSAVLFLLMAICPQNKLVLVDGSDDIPLGSVVIDVSSRKISQHPQTDNNSHSITSRRQIRQLMGNKMHSETIVFNREWVIQIVINRRVV